MYMDSSKLIGANVIGPGNANFRVASNALREAVPGLDICHYDEYVGVSEDHQDSDGSLISRARLVAKKSSRAKN